MVTFKVSDKTPEVFNLSTPHPSGGRESSTHTPVLPEGHYLNILRDYKEEGCGRILQESAWDVSKSQPLKNGFVDSVLMAYNRHHNLVLRPDDVWLAIAVQFGAFVNGNAEVLRTLFVSHDGRKEIVVKQGANLSTADYSIMATDFVDQLRKNIKDPSLVDWILPAFSTTTSDDTIISSVVMMATMKKYFTYKFELLCGIPEVTLLGTLEDWQEVLNRTNKLKAFGEVTTKWAGILQKVLRQFVAAVKGNVDIAFWERICSHHRRGSGTHLISGWISTFCVFNQEGLWQGGGLDAQEYPFINAKDIPPGYVTVPVKIDDNGSVYDSLMFAGHTLAESVNDTTLVPKAAWAIVLK